MSLICINGRFENEEAPLLTVSNAAFKYGDGVFETMLMQDGVLENAQLHFERLQRSLQLVEMEDELDENLLVANMARLCRENGHNIAKLRMTVYRDTAFAGYVITSEKLDAAVRQLNEKGWSLCIHPFVRKSCDAYANIKSLNFLPYVMADKYRQEKNADECLVLNAFGNIADGSRTNIFLIKGGEVITPALHQGCIDGVMRKWIIDQLKLQGRIVKQTEVNVEMLEDADAVFLTNSVRGIKWAGSYGEKLFDKAPVEEIYSAVF